MSYEKLSIIVMESKGKDGVRSKTVIQNIQKKPGPLARADNF